MKMSATPVCISAARGDLEHSDKSSGPKPNLYFENNFMIHFENKSGISTPKLTGQILKLCKTFPYFYTECPLWHCPIFTAAHTSRAKWKWSPDGCTTTQNIAVIGIQASGQPCFI
jgi:hypothetical protein